MTVSTVNGVHMAQCPHDGNGCTGHSVFNDCWHLHPERAMHVNDCAKRRAAMALHPERYASTQPRIAHTSHNLP